MKTKLNVKVEQTLGYAIAFMFTDKNYTYNFYIGKKKYQHIKAVYDEREDGRGCNTIEVAYDYQKMKYIAISCEDVKNKVITII